MMVDDVNAKGIKLDMPSEPLHDPAFIGALNAAYDIGGPSPLSRRGADQRLSARLNERHCTMDRFTDRRVIVTGAGSGIGQATVARLLDEGAHVVGYDVSADGLAHTAAAAAEAGTGKRLTTAVLDVSSEDAVIAAVDAALVRARRPRRAGERGGHPDAAPTPTSTRWPTGTRPWRST